MSVGTALRSEGDGPPRVLVAAKAPLPGRAKTRLSPPLAPALAARLAHAFLADVLRAALAADASAGLLCPAADAADLRRLFPGVAVVVQPGDGLSAALAHGVRDGAAVVAGDAPGIRPEAIAMALSASADVVIAPSGDGGFGLIRMPRYTPAVFAGMTWSTGSVLAELTGACRAVGLTVDLLEPVADVDTVADLARIDLDHAPATRAVLGEGAVTHTAAAGEGIG
ncbi:MAG TPA: DUF2064 domain-containing protein [Gaiellales bacterium]